MERLRKIRVFGFTRNMEGSSHVFWARGCIAAYLRPLWFLEHRHHHSSHINSARMTSHRTGCQTTKATSKTYLILSHAGVKLHQRMRAAACLRAYTILYYTILYYTILYYTILYYTILYYTILYYTILYYTILYYTILYYTILYYTILCYTILYYTILYYTILYYTI